MIVPSGYGSFPSRKALIATSLPKTAPKLLRLPASWAEEIHLQSRYPSGISVTKGADCPSAWPRAGAVRVTSADIVATATKKNVKRFIVGPQVLSVVRIPLNRAAETPSNQKFVRRTIGPRYRRSFRIPLLLTPGCQIDGADCCTISDSKIR